MLTLRQGLRNATVSVCPSVSLSVRPIAAACHSGAAGSRYRSIAAAGDGAEQQTPAVSRGQLTSDAEHRRVTADMAGDHSYNRKWAKRSEGVEDSEKLSKQVDQISQRDRMMPHNCA